VVDPFTASGEWVRCALHAHTTESDGELSPALLAAHYRRAGFDVLAITDHWRIADADAPPLIVVPSVELNCVLPGGRDGHVLALGVEAGPDELRELAGGYPGLDETGAWITSRGGVAYLAHPYWTGVSPGTLELPASVTGIEVYNAGCQLEVGRGLSTVHWDELLEAGRLCPAIATDDSHHPGFDSGFAWTWLRVAERSRNGVLSALREGSLYASAGPVLHDVRRDGDTVEVRCSPCRSVTLVASKTMGAAVNAGRLGYRHNGDVVTESDDGLVTAAALSIPPGATYARIEVTDTAGRSAWAGPFRA
jgi:hypothetical protein